MVGIYLATLRGASLLPWGWPDWCWWLLTASGGYAARLPVCLPGLGLGTLTIVGTDFAMTGLWSAHALAASLPVALVVSNLLLLNQFPDVDADRQVGRSNVVIVYGPAIASRVFACIFCRRLCVSGMVCARRMVAGRKSGRLGQCAACVAGRSRGAMLTSGTRAIC